MKVTKHYEQDHVMLYVEDGDVRTCITLDIDSQMRRLGTAARSPSSKPKAAKPFIV